MIAPILVVIIGAGLAYYLVQGQTAQALTVPHATQPGEQQRLLNQNGISVPDAPFSQQTDFVAAGAGLAGSGLGIAAAMPALRGATAIPIAGAIIGIGVGIYEVFARHHAEAVKKEGQGMTVAVAHWNNGLAILVRGASQGFYGFGAARNIAAMKADLETNFADYLKVVGGFMKCSDPGGTPNIGRPKVGVSGGVSWSGGGHIPSTCNGPCSYAYNYVVPQWTQALQVMLWSANGKHGTFVIPALPADSKKQFSGSAGLSVAY